MSGWIFLIGAICLEVTGTSCMRLSQGFTKFFPSLGVGIFYLLAIGALTMALKTIPMNTAYAIWSGLGTALIALIGFFLFKESVSLVKVVSLLCIIIGVVGLYSSNIGH